MGSRAAKRFAKSSRSRIRATVDVRHKGGRTFGYRVSDDANRYYKSGKSFVYRHLPFWLASLVDRIAIVLVPLAVILIPGLKLVPMLYKWRINARIYQRYGELMALERMAFGDTTREQRADLLKRLDEIDRRIVTGKLPASAAELIRYARFGAPSA